MTSNVDLSECCICYDSYNRTDRAPISMGCGHTFCQSCVGRLASNKSFSCPVCRTVSTVGSDGFQKSLTLIRALEKLNLLPSNGTDENRPSTSSASKVVPSIKRDTTFLRTSAWVQQHGYNNPGVSYPEEVSVAAATTPSPLHGSSIPQRLDQNVDNRRTNQVHLPNTVADRTESRVLSDFVRIVNWSVNATTVPNRNSTLRSPGSTQRASRGHYNDARRNADMTNCCVCFCIYNDTARAPVSMSCGDIFCSACFRQLIKSGPITCPICRTDSVLPTLRR